MMERAPEGERQKYCRRINPVLISKKKRRPTENKNSRKTHWKRKKFGCRSMTLPVRVSERKLEGTGGGGQIAQAASKNTIRTHPRGKRSARYGARLKRGTSLQAGGSGESGFREKSEWRGSGNILARRKGPITSIDHPESVRATEENLHEKKKG